MSSVKKFKHNKRRNTGLIYEFLLRKISSSLIDEDVKTSKKALFIIKKYYFKNSTLDNEKQLFDAITETRLVNEAVSSSVLVEVKKRARRLEFRKIDIKKSNLIKEIHHSFGKSFFSDFEIDDYKAFASIQLYINGCNPKTTINESVQRIKIEESLLNFMMSGKKAHNNNNYDASDKLSYVIAVNKYNKKYNVVLSESQKNLLSSYNSSLIIENGNSKFSDYLNNQRDVILTFLKKSHSIKEVNDDKMVLDKLVAAECLLEQLDLSKPTDEDVEKIMLYCKLAEEIASK